MDNFKYEAKLNKKAYGDFSFIGTVKANSIKELKEKAKKHARSWNHFGKIYISEENKGLEFAIIS